MMVSSEGGPYIVGLPPSPFWIFLSELQASKLYELRFPLCCIMGKRFIFFLAIGVNGNHYLGKSKHVSEGIQFGWLLYLLYASNDSTVLLSQLSFIWINLVRLSGLSWTQEMNFRACVDLLHPDTQYHVYYIKYSVWYFCVIVIMLNVSLYGKGVFYTLYLIDFVTAVGFIFKKSLNTHLSEAIIEKKKQVE